MRAMARQTDLATSHAAAREVESSGAAGNQRLVVLDLLKRFPGHTYQELWQQHLADGRRRGTKLVFQDAPGLMRRLSEVGEKMGTRKCQRSGRTAAQRYPK